jgi:hypothetical protein
MDAVKVSLYWNTRTAAKVEQEIIEFSARGTVVCKSSTI